MRVSRSLPREVRREPEADSHRCFCTASRNWADSRSRIQTDTAPAGNARKAKASLFVAASTKHILGHLPLHQGGFFRPTSIDEGCIRLSRVLIGKISLLVRPYSEERGYHRTHDQSGGQAAGQCRQSPILFHPANSPFGPHQGSSKHRLATEPAFQVIPPSPLLSHSADRLLLQAFQHDHTKIALRFRSGGSRIHRPVVDHFVTASP